MIAWKNTNNLGYADNTTLMAKSKEELKNLLIKKKEETEKAGLKFRFKISPSNEYPGLISFRIDWGWKKYKLESRLLGEISITSDMQMTPPLWQKVKRN